MNRRDRAISLAAEKGCDLEQISVAYILAAPFPTFATCAARTFLEAEKNVKASEIALTSDEYSWLQENQ
jgi:aryl-alcohol dehydrogenase-like predicted oxidoreductase